MKRRIGITAILVLSVVLLILLGACGNGQPGEITGRLMNAADGTITVSGDEGPVEIKTGKETVYRLGETDKLCIGDTVNVTYHESLGNKNADVVTLVEHIQQDLVFEGTVVQIKDEMLLVTGKSLTVSFIRNEKTKVEGKLTVGDTVEVVYTGDISEYPYAKKVTVTEENKKPKVRTVSGIVSEFTETTVLIAIDSARSYRFKISPETKITGVSKYVRVGDSVTVSYSEKVDETPLATEINIVMEAQEERQTVNGSISRVESNYLTLDTGKKVHVIYTNEKTKYSGDKPEKGCKAEITYTGKLDKDATATNIFCVKKTPEPEVTYKVTFTDGNGTTLNTQTVRKGEAAKAPANPSMDGYTFKGWDKDFSKVKKNLTVNATWEENPEPEPEPENESGNEPEPEKEPLPENAVEAEGRITKWGIDGLDQFSVLLDDGGMIILEVGDYTDVAAGYTPEEEDIVKVSYMKEDMKALRIELLEKGKSDDEGESGEAAGEGDEGGSGESGNEPATEPEQATNPESDKEPAADEETASEPESAPEPEPVQEPDVKIDAQGSIVEGDEEKQTCTILTDDGETITLNITKDTKIASGYFPQKGDVVKITYTKTAMLLRDIQLINRPEPVPEPEPEAAEEASSEDGDAKKEEPAEEAGEASEEGTE